jgi:ABC-type multidrug transport system ATPase subunit
MVAVRNAASADNLVEARNLTKRYPGGVLAVNGLNLTVRRGEVYGFLGPNGAGKTTTLRMLTGLMQPTAGTATVVGSTPGSPHSLSRLGALIEAPAFWPYLSGRDNLRLLARYCRVSDRRVSAVLDEVEMSNVANRQAGAYSTGMKQRLGVAAALLKDPELLILDEPTSGLDPQGMADFRTLITRIGQGQRTVLLSSHLLGEVEQTCSRIGIISAGRMVVEGTIDEIRGSSHLRVRAEPATRALNALVPLFGADRVTAGSGGTIMVTVDASRASEVTRCLVTAGVSVTEVRLVERSLEEVFMELTGTESGK